MGTKVVKPVVLDETVRGMNETLEGIKDILDNKMFTPSVIVDEKTITENGVYEATDDNADGYKKIIVNVSGGGGIDFESVMLQNVSPATVPSSWEIPVDVTEIPDNYEARGALLDNKSALTTVTLADGHTGLTEVGDSAFSEFGGLASIDFADGAKIKSSAFYGSGVTTIPSSLHLIIPDDTGNTFGECGNLESIDMTNMEYSYSGEEIKGVYSMFKGCSFLKTATNILVDMEYREGETGSYGGTLHESMFAGTKVKEPTFKNTVKFIRGGCFEGLDIENDGDGIFKDTQGKITNESYKIHEYQAGALGYKFTYEDWSTGERFEVFTSVRPNGGTGTEEAGFDTEPTLYADKDVTVLYTGDKFYVRDSGDETSDKRYRIGVRDKSEDAKYDGNGEYYADSYDSRQFADSNAKGFYMPNLVKISISMFEGDRNVETFAFDNAARVGEKAFCDCNSMETLSLERCEYFDCRAIQYGCDNLTEIDFSLAADVVELNEEWSFPDKGITVKVPLALLADFHADEKWQTLINEKNVTLQGV